MTNYLGMDVVSINELLKSKKIKPIDLVNEFEEKIKGSNLNAFITLNLEEAKKTAIMLEEKEVDNLLFGIPIALKDNISTESLRTTCGSKMLSDYIPIFDASVVKKLKAKNMIIIGKTNMDEFAMGSTGETSYFGNTLSPLDSTLVPGGSSSGSAAAVAGSLVPLALGSDTGGSIRQPASFTGIVGLKPTYGRVSRYGLIAFASSLDQIGPFARTVLENALLFDAINGVDENDYTSSVKEKYTFNGLELNKKLKIAIPNYYVSDLIDKEIKEKIASLVSFLVKEGHIVEYIDVPFLDYAIPLYQVIALSEASSNLARFDGIKFGHKPENYDTIDDFYIKSRSEGFGREVKRRIMVGTYVLSGENADKYYYKALKVRKKLTSSISSVFEKYDLVIGPTNTNVAYKLGIKKDVAESFLDDLLTIPFNMSGNPALSLPIGFNSFNLPIGLQIAGDYFNEDLIYRFAKLLEEKRGEF